MKIAFLIGLAVIIAVTAVGLSSCAGLNGTTIGFTPEGVVITPPATPIVIPTK